MIDSPIIFEIQSRLNAKVKQLRQDIDFLSKTDPAMILDIGAEDIGSEALQSTTHDNISKTIQDLQNYRDEVDLSLNKIDQGVYGICENCGNDIDENRLAVLPTASLCKSCA